MKILSVGNFGFGWDGSICDEEHIAAALEGFGHEVVRWQRGTDLNVDVVPATLDFVLVAQWDGYRKGFIDNLKHYNGVPVVYWAFDYQADGQEWHEHLVREADLYLSKRIADSKYPNWQWLPQDFAPPFLNKITQPFGNKKTIDVLFTGTYLPWAAERNETLKAVDEKFNLVIHSVNPEAWTAAGFKDVRGPVMDEKLPELIASAKVNLSIDHTLEAGYWSDRNAQIMACGGFVLFRYVPMSSMVFRSNIGYFYDLQTCLDCTEFWLEAEEDRENLAGFGYDFALNNLSARERVADLLTIVQEVM